MSHDSSSAHEGAEEGSVRQVEDVLWRCRGLVEIVPRFGRGVRVPGVSENFSLASSAEKSAREAHLPPSGRRNAASMKWSACARREVGGWLAPHLAHSASSCSGSAELPRGCLGVPALSAAMAAKFGAGLSHTDQKGTCDYDSATRPTVERASGACRPYRQAPLAPGGPSRPPPGTRHGEASGPQPHPNFIEVFSGPALGGGPREVAGAGEDGPDVTVCAY